MSIADLRVPASLASHASCLSRSLDVRVEWMLAGVLRTMSECALVGTSPQCIAAVRKHLQAISESMLPSDDLRLTCDELLVYWDKWPPT